MLNLELDKWHSVRKQAEETRTHFKNGINPYKLDPPEGLIRLDFEQNDQCKLNEQQEFYIFRHRNDVIESEIVAFRNVWIDPSRRQREHSYISMLKSIRRETFDEFAKKEFLLDGGTDSRWCRAAIVVGVKLPSDLLEAISPGFASSRLLQYFALHMDKIVLQSYSLIYVATPKAEKEDPHGPSCLEALLGALVNKYVYNLQRVFVIHAPLWTSVTTIRIASAEVVCIHELEELFNHEEGHGFDPEELIFPEFVYEYEGTNHDDFTSAMTKRWGFVPKSNDRSHYKSQCLRDNLDSPR